MILEGNCSGIPGSRCIATSSLCPMQMYILDGKAFAALQESGQHNCEAAVDECMLLANNQVIFAMSSQLHISCKAISFKDMYLCKQALDSHHIRTSG